MKKCFKIYISVYLILMPMGNLIEVCEMEANCSLAPLIMQKLENCGWATRLLKKFRERSKISEEFTIPLNGKCFKSSILKIICSSITYLAFYLFILKSFKPFKSFKLKPFCNILESYFFLSPFIIHFQVQNIINALSSFIFYKKTKLCKCKFELLLYLF